MLNLQRRQHHCPQRINRVSNVISLLKIRVEEKLLVSFVNDPALRVSVLFSGNEPSVSAHLINKAVLSTGERTYLLRMVTMSNRAVLVKTHYGFWCPAIGL